MSSEKRKRTKMVLRGVASVLGLALIVAGGALLALENTKNHDNKIKTTDDESTMLENENENENRAMNDPNLKEDNNNNQNEGNTENDANEEKEEKNDELSLYADIGEEVKLYLKSLLSPQNPSSCIQNVHEYNDEQSSNDNDIPKLLPFRICSMNIDPNLIYNILSYLPIENILTIQTIDEKFFALSNHILNNRKYLRSCARRGFYNRSIVWPWIVAQSIEGYNDLYTNKLFQWRQIENNELETKEFKDTYHALVKDIHRTFSNNRVLNLSEQQQHQLQTLLGVYSLLDPEVGYVQGMNFIAGAIILAVGDELDAFGIFCQLMKRDDSIIQHDKIAKENIDNIYNGSKCSNDYRYCAGGRLSKTPRWGYGLRDLFTPCLPGCVVALVQFDQLFQKHLPALYKHMKYEGLAIQSFASEWFITLYAYVLPLSITFRIYDLFLVDGWKMLHRIGLAILSRVQNILLTFTLDDMILYLKQFPDSGIFISCDDEEEGDAFIEHAFSFKVTNYGLHKCAVDLLNKTTL